MNEKDQRYLLDQVDASGFPLQLRLEHEVRSLQGAPDAWNVVATELRWEDPRSGKSGFVDMVIERGPVCFVIECKRRTGGSWTFLAPAESEPSLTHMRFCYADKDLIRVMDYGTFGPSSVESNYCVVPGSGGESKRSLESIASELVLATEAIAERYRTLRVGQSFLKMAFVPMIVCIPPPAVARFSVEDISLETGTLGENAEVENEPHVRFRKSFAPLRESGPFPPIELGLLRNVASLRDVADDHERTVLIVAAESFTDYLSELRPLPQIDMFPR